MDDLAGLDWTPDSTVPKPPLGKYSTFQSTPPPPFSRESTPLSAQQSENANSKASSGTKPSGSANDTFSSLLAPKPSKINGSVSLQERQRQLQEEKARALERQQQQYYSDAQYWEGLGSGRGTPAPAPSPSPEPILSNDRLPQSSQLNNDDDILSAFNSSAPVDSSSHFPPPRLKSESNVAPPSVPPGPTTSIAFDDNDDDDPFGLSQLPQKTISTAAPVPSSTEDDDILGALGQPVSVRPIDTAQERPIEDLTEEGSGKVASAGHPAEPAVAELVEMGFPADKAREALEHTDTGTDVQAAVGWLLTKAHAESKGRSKSQEDHIPSNQASKSAEQDSRSRSKTPAWTMQQDRQTAAETNQSSSLSEKDVKQYAAEFSSTFIKSANSFWKTSQKRVQRVVAEYKQEGDPSQPKWMREVSATGSTSTILPQPVIDPTSGRAQLQESKVTHEALMLESGRSTAPIRPSQKKQLDPRHAENAIPQTRQRIPPAEFDAVGQRPSTTFLAQPVPPGRRADRLSKQVLEDESAHVYVSPARRRNAPVKVEDTELSLDIFSTKTPEQRTPRTKIPEVNPVMQSRTFTTIQVRPKPVSRQFTQIPPTTLSLSNTKRQNGTEAFKRGDYAVALLQYSDALSSLPENHPVAIIVHCNRALTNIKVGDPKAAIIDADAALSIIGPSQGEDEIIAVGGSESDKNMKEFYGKALMRKAEALEHMEKWRDAAKVWREAVQGGVGGAISIQGRNRCEKALGISTGNVQSNGTSVAPRNPPLAKKTALRSAFNDLNGSMNPGTEAEAVKRLRAANAAAEAASDEAFALSDIVEARLVAWKAGKADNLRALLASLDAVLWPEAGWTKVGMSDLVLPPRVKIIYMKAIAKVHPDKISPNATTEQKMISASVFASLNEAWDGFKRDNSL